MTLAHATCALLRGRGGGRANGVTLVSDPSRTRPSRPPMNAPTQQLSLKSESADGTRIAYALSGARLRRWWVNRELVDAPEKYQWRHLTWRPLAGNAFRKPDGAALTINAAAK